MPGGYVFHAHNRAAGGVLFPTDWDYREFSRLIDAARRRHPIRLLGYCLLPAEWQLVVWPRADGAASAFLRWLTHAHVMGWRADHPDDGRRRLYRGRFRSFPVEAAAWYAMVRHVERAPVRAGLVARAEDWPWSSLDDRRDPVLPGERLSRGPARRPRDWLGYVNREPSAAEVAALERSAGRGSPFGSPGWQVETARRLGLESTLRPRGRPRKGAG